MTLAMTIKFDGKVIDLDDVTWNSICWVFVDSEVKRLRSRIFKASQQKNNTLVKKLQRLMMRSVSNIMISVRKVTTQGTGNPSPGLDGTMYLKPEQRMNLVKDLVHCNLNTWQPPAVKKVSIIKVNGRQKLLGTTVKDLVIQAMANNALEPEWEAKFETMSYGFRPSRSYLDAVTRIHCMIKNKANIWVLTGDISNCFCESSHNYLITKLTRFPYVYLIKRWLKAGIMDNKVYYETDMGPPQGKAISPLLCNIILHGLEEELNIGSNCHVAPNPVMRTIITYADDFIIICPTKTIAQTSLKQMDIHLSKRGLKINNANTRIVNCIDGFDFLGVNFRYYIKRGYEHVNLGNVQHGIEVAKRKWLITLTTPSKTSVMNIKHKIRAVFKTLKGHPVKLLIKALNPIIKNYCENKRLVVFSRVAIDLNRFLFRKQLNWLKKAHPNKSTKWIVNKYYKPLNTNFIKTKWVFTDPDSGYVCYQFTWFNKPRNWKRNCVDNPKLKDDF